jgi:hypothetical protein
VRENLSKKRGSAMEVRSARAAIRQALRFDGIEVVSNPVNEECVLALEKLVKTETDDRTKN